MLEMKPDTGLAVKDGMEQEVATDCLMCRFHRCLHVARQRLMFVGMDQHQAVVVIARQEQRLPGQAAATPRKFAHGSLVERSERQRQRPVDSLETGDEARALGRILADCVIQGPWSTDCALDKACQAPHATNEGGVGGAVLERSIFLFEKIFDPYIRVRRCWRQLDDDAEEGVLYEDCLPDLAPLLHLLGGGTRVDNGRVSVEA